MDRQVLIVSIITLLSCISCVAVEVPPTPTNTLRPTNTQAIPESSMGTPIPSWDEIPIMDNAIEGDEAGLGYIYAVDVLIDEADTFYQEEMALAGWELIGRSTSDTSMFGGPSVTLDFKRGDELFNIMMIYSTNDEYTMVMLTRLSP